MYYSFDVIISYSYFAFISDHVEKLILNQIKSQFRLYKRYRMYQRTFEIE